MLQAVLFFGRQVGRFPTDQGADWLGWLGVWPVAITIGAATWCVLCFPEGRFLSPRWRRLAIGAVALAGACSLLSALWPVEYDETGVVTDHPLSLAGADTASSVWNAVGHPVYVLLQLLWVVAVAARWRQSDGVVRRQLTVMLVAVGVSVLGLLVGWSPPAAQGPASCSSPPSRSRPAGPWSGSASPR